MNAVTVPVLTLTMAERAKAGWYKCNAPQSVCGRDLGPWEAYVCDLTNLYLGQRGLPVDEAQPLTLEELRLETRCKKHPLTNGIRMFLITEIAGLMDRWIAQNTAKLAAERRQAELREQEERRKRRLNFQEMEAKRREEIARGVLPAIRYRSQEEPEGPRPQRRFHPNWTERPKERSEKKKYGDETKSVQPQSDKKNKNKQKKGAENKGQNSKKK